MTAQPKHNISGQRANDLLVAGLPLADFYIDGNVKIVINGSWNKEVIIDNCIIEKFDGSVTQFDKPVKFTNSHFKDCAFVFSYFIQGLFIDNCTFGKYLDFQAGGHNQSGHAVIIQNSTFLSFVNFFDCWFNGQVLICNNKFDKGTNIESLRQLISFDIPSTIHDNIGLTNVEAECAD